MLNLPLPIVPINHRHPRVFQGDHWKGLTSKRGKKIFHDSHHLLFSPSRLGFFDTKSDNSANLLLSIFQNSYPTDREMMPAIQQVPTSGSITALGGGA